MERRSRTTAPLVAANGSLIRTWGTKKISITIGKRVFTHSVQLADVTRPILGADFFVANNLAIDLKNKRLIDMSDVSKLGGLHRTPKSHLPIVSGLSKEPHNEFTAILNEFPDILVPRFNTQVNKHGVEHHIVTAGPPVSARARRLHGDKLDVAKKEFLKMEELGIIQRSDSPWSSPLHVVPKSDGSWRPCGDYRRLNNATKDDKYPLPHIQDFNLHLAGAKWFSKIDLMRGYHQIPMAADSIPKTAIVTPFGLWEFLRMPFGLKNAAQAFQRLMDGILRDVPFAFVYLDDILIASRTKEDHVQHIRQLLELLSTNGLIIRKEKCVFGVQELEYLGHLVTTAGIKPLPSRVKAIIDFPVPTDMKSLQRFIGMINFYHRFMPGIAEALAPLHVVASGKGNDVAWSDTCQRSFDAAKAALSEATLLTHPHPRAPTSITVDASNTAIGGQLEQLQGKAWRPVAFFSKKLSAAQRKYSAFDRELVALHETIKHYRHFLEGRKFVAFTDHKPLTTAIHSQADRSPRQTRQLSFIAEFTSDIRHISGKCNVVADTLSRIETVGVPPVDYTALALSQQQSLEVQAYQTAVTNLKIQPVSFSNTSVLCDVSTGVSRPIVPPEWRKPIFNAIHGLSHAGNKPTQRAMSSRFVWHGMGRDIAKWCRECMDCQQSKVSKHVKTPLSDMPLPSARFGSLNLDLVGPLPPSEGMTYLLTIVDRFTRWPEAIPLPDAKTETVIKGLLRNWLARMGVPTEVVTDRGPQFTSDLWKQLHDMFGIKVSTTTAYHPQANGMVERMHRQLKDSLKARATHQRWMDELPFVLLGLRTTWRQEPDCSPAELVYGQALNVPGQFLPDPDKQATPNLPFLRNLQDTVRKFAPTPPTRHGQQPVQLSKNLMDADYVFVRKDGYKLPLTRPYSGPYKVVKSGPKYFVLDLDGRVDKVSTDRLKRAFIPPSWMSCTGKSVKPDNISPPKIEAQPRESQATPTPKKSRFGRPLLATKKYQSYRSALLEGG